MKTKIRPFGWINLSLLTLLLFFIIVCIATPSYYLVVHRDIDNLFLFIPIILVYPLILVFMKNYGKSIEVKGDRIIFKLDTEDSSLLKIPSFYEDEFKLSDLKFYGVFTGVFILGYEKADRKKAAEQDSEITYDVLKVKEGDLKVPLGAINIGSPLAFVFNNQQYIIDDYLFTPEQYELLFHTIEKSTGIKPSGAIKAIMPNNDQKSSFNSFGFIISLVLSLIIPVILGFSLQALGNPAFDLSNLSSPIYAIMLFVGFGNIATSITLRTKMVRKRNALINDTVGYVSKIGAILSYLVVIAVFLFIYL